MTKSVKTITAKIYLGLREGYTSVQHNINEVNSFLQEYIDKIGLCVTSHQQLSFIKMEEKKE